MAKTRSQMVEEEFGLEDGCVPAGKPCPFLNDCTWKFERCPTHEDLHDNPFSCAAARLTVLVVALARQQAR